MIAPKDAPALIIWERLWTTLIWDGGRGIWGLFRATKTLSSR